MHRGRCLFVPATAPMSERGTGCGTASIPCQTRRIPTPRGVGKKRKPHMQTRGEIRQHLEKILSYWRCVIATANHNPMYINCEVKGGILACDVSKTKSKVRVSFFWRSVNDLQKPSDAKLHSKDYFDGMTLPNGYSVRNKGGKEGFRWEKDYSNGYSDEEIAKEIACVFNLFGPVEVRNINED